ncbi:TetR family transcriptional regulator [Micromonospora tarensis]|uniref:TetR family transcriptional regulator n=1 Tax=Micromonospora tarensis TaxID=2806100 RepID=A0ABS1YDM2_9ACTN|nr:TetR family transcriptional regulator [Micromonospora tarensis]MBM0275513.1 TetR family transcriptional regulator [Micromonospora tarensis]
MGLREIHRLRTRQAIQEHAMRLFAERGFDTTTVADVAAAAEVSSMTVFRYFPTKEDLVLADDHDPIIVDHIRAQPTDQPMIQRIGTALLESTSAQSPDERAMLLARLRIGLSVPALRSRMWDGQYQTQRYIAEALADEGIDEFELWVAAGACISAATAAIVRWAERGGTEDLAELMAVALRIVIHSSDRSPS